MAISDELANGSFPLFEAWGGRYRFSPPAAMGTEYAFAKKKSCRSRPLKAERQVSGGLLPD
jgi:hypothetical protein